MDIESIVFIPFRGKTPSSLQIIGFYNHQKGGILAEESANLSTAIKTLCSVFALIYLVPVQQK